MGKKFKTACATVSAASGPVSCSCNTFARLGNASAPIAHSSSAPALSHAMNQTPDEVNPSVVSLRRIKERA